MKKILAVMLASMLVLTACSSSKPTDTSSSSSGATAAPEKKKMTEYTAIYTAEIDTINYMKTTGTDAIALFYSIGDGLIEFDRFGEMKPCQATDWTVSDDGTIYTFKLRKDLKWYTYDGKEYSKIVAQDYVDSMKWILTKVNAASTANTVYDVIKNAKAYYNEEITDFSQVGIRAVDEYTVEYTLKQPTPYFLKQLSFPCFFPVNGKFLADQGEQFGVEKDNILYSGAYLLKSFEPQSERVLVANPNYWDKDVISIGTLSYRYNAESNAIGTELFSRGEINDFILPGSILDEWMNNPEKKELMCPNNLTNMSYYIGLNFEPNYEAEYKPDDWKIAVNNENFRKSIFHGMDRKSAALTMEPYNPESKLLNTLTRRNLAQANGVDYTMMSGLKAYTEKNSFDSKLALEYKTKAMAELTGKVTFPLKVLMPFSTAKVDTANRMQVIEQQLETVLGKDYIDIILQSAPSTGFSKQVRDPGKFSIMELGWGPDFADPLGSMNPVYSTSLGGKYTRVHLATDLLDTDGKSKFEKMVDAADLEVKDLAKRYELFAEAEAMLLDKAIIIPFYTSGGGYRATYLDPFSGLTGQMGRNGAIKLKGAVIMDKPLGMTQYPAALAKYEAERAEALKAAK